MLPPKPVLSRHTITTTADVSPDAWQTDGNIQKIIITENGTIACQGDTLMSGYVGDENDSKYIAQ